jgi:hypothetical protein
VDHIKEHQSVALKVLLQRVLHAWLAFLTSVTPIPRYWGSSMSQFDV